MNSPPHSLSPRPLKSLGEYNYDLFEEDFATNQYTFESKVTSAAGGIIDFKGVKCGKQYQEVNVQFPWRNYYMWMGSRDNKIEVHVDLGEVSMPQELGKLNLFTGFKYGDGDTVFRLGALQQFKNSLSHIRLQHKRSKWSLVQRGTYTHKNVVISDVRNFDISNRQLTRYDFLLGYQTNDYDFYLRHYSKPNPTIKLFNSFGIGRVVADVVYRKNGHTFGAEISSGQDNTYKNVQAAVAYSTKVNDVAVKAKFDLRQNTLWLSAKVKINEHFGFTIATEVGLKHHTYYSGPYPLPIGLTLSLTP